MRAGGASVAARCRDKALRAITDLVASGWEDRSALETDPDLEAVRGEAKFTEMLNQIPAPPAR